MLKISRAAVDVQSHGHSVSTLTTGKLAVFNKNVEMNAKLPTATNKVLQNVMQDQVRMKASQHSKKFQVLQASVSSNGKLGDREMNDYQAKMGKILETIMNVQYEIEETSWHQISQKKLTNQYPAKHVISFPGGCGLYIDCACMR